MNFIGVDPSLTASGIVVLDDSGEMISSELIETSPKETDKTKRIAKIKTDIYKYLKYKNNTIWHIEGLSHRSEGRGTLDLAAVHYVITVMLHQNFVNFKEIPPKSLKVWVGGKGKGNAKKDLMLLLVYKRWGIEFHDHNLADAYALARMAYEERNKDAG